MRLQVASGGQKGWMARNETEKMKRWEVTLMPAGSGHLALAPQGCGAPHFVVVTQRDRQTRWYE